MTIGQRIKARREELRLSQDELAKALGYKSRSSLNKIELDQRDLPQSKIKAIADALATTPSYIMGWSTDPDKHQPLNFSQEEVKIIQEYRRLSDYGKSFVLQALTAAKTL